MMSAPVTTVAERAPVAVVGLGRMGEAMAERLLEGGYPLLVYNRTSEKARPLVERGAELLDGPEAALARADVCFTSLADDAALEDVAGRVLAGARAGGVLVETSTVSADASARVAALAEAASVAYLRAPVSGNPGVVRA